jgi:hypothetical protein
MSPFPGMDPYIEVTGSWSDFHNDLLVGCRAQLHQHLPPNYIARIEERVTVVSQEDEEHGPEVVPDAVISRAEGLRYKEPPPAEFAEAERAWVAERAAGTVAK